MLKMKSECERCSTALALQAPAVICSYECTFCDPCAEALAHVCPNCDGELVRRPTRMRAPLPVAAGLVRRRLSSWLGHRRGGA